MSRAYSKMARATWSLAFVGAAGCARSPSPAHTPTPTPPPITVDESVGASHDESEDTKPGAFRWSASSVPPIRVVPLNHRGEPIPCVAGSIERPCDIEVTAQGELIQRSRSWSVVGRMGPGLAVHDPEGGQRLFALEPNGTLFGLGPFQRPDAAQMLFCRLTDEPALHCHHELRPAVAGRVWNETNCSAEFVARVKEGTVTVSSPAYPNEPPSVAAVVEPAPADDNAKALALFLLAMATVDLDTDHHTPYVSDPQVPR